jgi:CMP-N-acetylneuraminic acid synthetase
MLPVIEHVLEWADALNQPWDAVCVLQPTAPLRRPEDIDACVSLLDRPDVDSAVTVVPVPPKFNPRWVYWRTTEGLLRLSTGEPTPVTRRQDLRPAYHRDGAVYAVRVSVVKSKRSLYGDRVAACLTDPSRAVNIDTLDDWRLAEQWLRRHTGRRRVQETVGARPRHSH